MQNITKRNNSIAFFITVCYTYIKECSVVGRDLLSLRLEVMFMTKREKALYAIISLLFILVFILLFK